MSANPQHQATAIVLTPPALPDFTAISAQIANFQLIITDLGEQAGRMIITSEADFAKGTDLLTLLKTNGDELETLRKKVKQPIDAIAAGIQNVFNPIKDQVSAADLMARNKLTAWRNEQDRKAREEQERVRREQEEALLARAAELEKQGKTEAANAVVEMAAAPLPPPQKTEAFRGSYGGKASTQDQWTAEVVNMREFLKSVLDGTTNFNLDDITVGQAALNKLAKAVKVEGVKNGVKIAKNTGLTLRR